jgi:hypothetical protein
LQKQEQKVWKRKKKLEMGWEQGHEQVQEVLAQRS